MSGREGRPQGARGEADWRRRITEADLRLIYDVFLGQAVVPQDTIDKRIGADPAKFIALVVTSQRFAANVVNRLNAGVISLPGAMSRTVTTAMLAQIADLFNLPQLIDLFEPGDIPSDEFFLRLLTWPDFLALLSESTREQLRLSPAAQRQAHRIVGAVDGYFAGEITGWAMNQNAPEERLALEFLANGALIGSTICREPRQDVRGYLESDAAVGFRFPVPLDLPLRLGADRFSLSVRDVAGKRAIAPPMLVNLRDTPSQGTLQEIRRRLDTLSREISELSRMMPRYAREASYPLARYADAHDAWLQITPAEREALHGRGARLRHRPTFSLVVAEFPAGPPSTWRCFEAARRQIYDRWELVIAYDSPNGDHVLEPMRRAYGLAPEQCRLVACDPGASVVERLNAGFQVATGDYIGSLDAADLLADDCLFALALQVQDEKPALIYGDSDRIASVEGGVVHHDPFFKPDLDRDLLLQQPYFGFCVFSAAALKSAGAFDLEFEGVHHHDMALRVVEAVGDEKVRHVQAILHHSAGEPQRNAALDESTLASRRDRMIEASLERSGALAARVRPWSSSGSPPAWPRIDWGFTSEALPSVSIIIPTRDRLDLLGPCLDSVLASRDEYRGSVEVIVVDNQSSDPSVLERLQRLEEAGDAVVIRYPNAFNWSLMNNLAVEQATGDVLIFLNNDTVVSTRSWLQELVAQAMRSEVGAVGAKLLYADGSIQHGGVLGGIGGIAVHDGLGCEASESGYHDRHVLVHGAIAVTGACMAVRASLFQSLGGFDAVEFGVAFNDLDFCLRLRQAGYRVLYDPYVILFHYESRTRGFDITDEKRETNRQERAAFYRRWGKLTLADPFYNSNFDRTALPFTRIRPTAREPDGNRVDHAEPAS